MPGISAARARARPSKLVVDPFKSQNTTSGIYARDFRGVRARARPSKLVVDPFRSKTLLPGSMAGISAARARASFEARLRSV